MGPSKREPTGSIYMAASGYWLTNRYKPPRAPARLKKVAISWPLMTLSRKLQGITSTTPHWLTDLPVRIWERRNIVDCTSRHVVTVMYAGGILVCSMLQQIFLTPFQSAMFPKHYSFVNFLLVVSSLLDFRVYFKKNEDFTYRRHLVD